jgi:hypothetical protein
LEEEVFVQLGSVQFGGFNYTKNDIVVVANGEGELGEEMFGQIQHVFVAEDAEGERRIFIELAFFEVPLDGLGSNIGGEGHGLTMLGPLPPIGMDRTRLESKLLWHIVLYVQPDETPKTSQHSFVIETSYPRGIGFRAEDVYIPLYPKVSSCSCFRLGGTLLYLSFSTLFHLIALNHWRPCFLKLEARVKCVILSLFLCSLFNQSNPLIYAF